MRILCISSFLSFIDTLFLYLRSCDHYWHTLYLFFSICECMFFFYLPLTCVVSFLSLCTCFLLLVCNLLFLFHTRCLDEFCLKYFRNTSCQSLLVINSLLAKFFKSLCYDRFYCIQQVNMSWMIYDFSHMFICLLWFFHGLPKGEIIRTYVIHLLGTYVTILCNWLILWQNVFYL